MTWWPRDLGPETWWPTNLVTRDLVLVTHDPDTHDQHGAQWNAPSSCTLCHRHICQCREDRCTMCLLGSVSDRHVGTSKPPAPATRKSAGSSRLRPDVPTSTVAARSQKHGYRGRVTASGMMYRLAWWHYVSRLFVHFVCHFIKTAQSCTGNGVSNVKLAWMKIWISWREQWNAVL